MVPRHAVMERPCPEVATHQEEGLTVREEALEAAHHHLVGMEEAEDMVPHHLE